MTLQQCSETKTAFNQIAKLEQQITVRDSIIHSPVIVTQDKKINIIKEIIRIVEFYLEVTGKKLETYHIQVLSGDLYDKFKNDTLDDIIMMFKMMRTGELLAYGQFNEYGDRREKRYNETFNDKIMMFADYYMYHKAQEREKLINLKKRKIRDQEKEVPMSDEAYAKFTELQKRIAAPVKKSLDAFSINKILSSMDAYLDSLPESCKKLSDGDLRYELRKTETINKTAHAILLQEQDRRKQLKPQK